MYTKHHARLFFNKCVFAYTCSYCPCLFWLLFCLTLNDLWSKSISKNVKMLEREKGGGQGVREGGRVEGRRERGREKDALQCLHVTYTSYQLQVKYEVWIIKHRNVVCLSRYCFITAVWSCKCCRPNGFYATTLRKYQTFYHFTKEKYTYLREIL